MTSTPTPPKQGVRARERNALERIAELEASNQRLVGAIQQAFADNDQKIRDISEVLEVFVSEKGADVVKEKMAELRRARAEATAKQAKDQLDLALVEGKLEVVEVVADDSIITGVEKDKDGTVLVPGYVQLAVSAVKPEFVEKMKGQKVGFVFETEGGGQFEVTGIYKTVEQPAPEEAPAAEAPAAQ